VGHPGLERSRPARSARPAPWPISASVVGCVANATSIAGSAISRNKNNVDQPTSGPMNDKRTDPMLTVALHIHTPMITTNTTEARRP